MLEEKRTDIGLSRMEYKLENDRIKETKISSLSFWSLEEAIESMKRKNMPHTTPHGFDFPDGKSRRMYDN